MRYVLLVLMMLSGCATFPDLDDSITDAAREAPYPSLEPLPSDPFAIPAAEVALDERIAALQARAARLRAVEIGALQ
ncbi:hypothetical protein SLH49_06800 [Cognatiyoonia sp. IB215446]|uniref:hypothetical protein n=1 Tax=Cognatiyoonia sp. IB215446 TaxID=3097355 RepID=UPI002A16721F|nr:hypothetical protein [Cognatiyoonia sp. IB215446]MDX8347690.1 hypothetical protein [Cognatiyoonia sp. IB215446]